MISFQCPGWEVQLLPEQHGKPVQARAARDRGRPSDELSPEGANHRRRAVGHGRQHHQETRFVILNIFISLQSSLLSLLLLKLFLFYYYLLSLFFILQVVISYLEILSNCNTFLDFNFLKITKLILKSTNDVIGAIFQVSSRRSVTPKHFPARAPTTWMEFWRAR